MKVMCKRSFSKVKRDTFAAYFFLYILTYYIVYTIYIDTVKNCKKQTLTYHNILI